MSIAAPSIKRPWALVGLASAILLALIAGLVFMDLPGERLLSPGVGEETSTQSQGLPQATWRIKTHPAGVVDKVTKAQAARIKQQSPQVGSLVKKVYDAILLHPGRLPSALAENFTPAAAAALRRSGVVAPEAGVISTTKRRAQIGIQAAGGPTLAIATVSLEATFAERPERAWDHRATLWMQRGKSGWQVVAFEVDQRPQQALGGSKPDNDAKNGRHKTKKRPRKKKRG